MDPFCNGMSEGGYLLTWATLPKGVINTFAGRGEPDGAVGGHVEMVFEADAKLAIDTDHRFVRETHTGGKRCVIAPIQIGPFVNVKTNSVARPVR